MQHNNNKVNQIIDNLNQLKINKKLQELKSNYDLLIQVLDKFDKTIDPKAKEQLKTFAKKVYQKIIDCEGFTQSQSLYQKIDQSKDIQKIFQSKKSYIEDRQYFQQIQNFVQQIPNLLNNYCELKIEESEEIGELPNTKPLKKEKELSVFKQEKKEEQKEKYTPEAKVEPTSVFSPKIPEPRKHSNWGEKQGKPKLNLSALKTEKQEETSRHKREGSVGSSSVIGKIGNLRVEEIRSEKGNNTSRKFLLKNKKGEALKTIEDKHPNTKRIISAMKNSAQNLNKSNSQKGL